jgi:hypothetical protein
MKYLALSLLALSGAANATIITIEPDDYAHGSVILPSHGASIAFVQHQNQSSQLTYRAAIAAFEITCADPVLCSAPTGTQVLSDGTLRNGQLARGVTSNLNALRFGPLTVGTDLDDVLSSLNAFTGVRVDFDAPTNFFGADLFSFPGDTVDVYAFSSEGVLLSRTNSAGMTTLDPDCSSPMSTQCARYRYNMQVSHDTADIGFVIFGSSGSPAFVDAIRFEVPEPATSALLCFGLAGLMLRRRGVQHRS